MDEEELQKRFTDCVYFLASPLTCKKGIECEYRHSEIARLNPRDCWYWLGGCCFNPDCPFRHPPLEGFKEAHVESSNPKNGPPTVPLTKSNIPCYFYSNGCCNKGEKCSFLHGPTTDPCKLSKAASTANNFVSSEKKLSSGSNSGGCLAPVENLPEPSENLPEPSENLPEPSESNTTPDSTERSESEESSRLGFFERESDVYDQSSDRRENWVLESSPGFDVLVEGKSGKLGFDEREDAPEYEYFSVHDEEILGYDPANPDLGIGKERYDESKLKSKSRASIFCRLSFQKTDLRTERIVNVRRGGPDLREHLKRYRKSGPRLVDHRVKGNPRKSGSRFSEFDFVDRNGSGGRLQKGATVKRYNQKPLKDKKPKRKTREVSAVFSGPKTLEQIKEEKKKAALRNGDLSGLGLNESDGFQGPRPLSEILEKKRKIGI